MTDERGLIRRVLWRDVIPGLMIVRCFQVATAMPVLFLATLGTLAMPVGPWLASRLATASPASADPLSTAPLSGEGTDQTQGETLQFEPARIPPETKDPFKRVPRSVAGLRLGLVDSYLTLVRPFAQLFDRQAALSRWLASLGTALWYLAVWSLCGGAITRIAVVRLGRGEHVPLRQATRHAARNVAWYVVSPLFPLAGIACAVVPLFFLGLFMRLGFGILVAGLLWPLVLLGGLFMTVLAVGLLFGWPLMWPTLGAEEASDSFQAFSNSFSFTFQRPLQYLAYAFAALVIGSLGGWFVEGFARGVIALAQWGVSFGLGGERLNQLVTGELADSGLVWLGGGLMALGDGLVVAIAAAFYYSFFFCASSAIYLLLRRDVDQTDFDEVYVPDTTAPFTLPAMHLDPHGAPELDATLAAAGDPASEP